MTRDELYPVIDEVLHERCHPYMNAGSEWIDREGDDVELRIHELAEALCDAVCKAVGDLTAERDASRLIINDLTAEVERLRAAGDALAVRHRKTFFLDGAFDAELRQWEAARRG